MPNHWHHLLWLREDGELSEVMRWITVAVGRERACARDFFENIQILRIPRKLL